MLTEHQIEVPPQELYLLVAIRYIEWIVPANLPGQKPVLVEDYLYQNLKTNVGLPDIDFDPANPKYGY